jgi:sec-independent protein translocase protein TatB
MLNLDPAKLLVIAVVAVILLGPERLPQVARQMGAAWRTFNEFRHRVETDVRSAVPDLPSTHDISRLARSPTALLNHLSNMGTEGETTTASADGVATVTTSNAAAGRQGDPEPGASDSSEAHLSDVDSPPLPPPAAEPEVLWPVDVVVSDPHLN